MAKEETDYMVTVHEFGSVGATTVALELTLDPRFKPSNIDLVMGEEDRKGFRKGQNPLVWSSLSRASTDTVLILCSLKSLGWNLVTSNAFVANEDEFHRMFYFESRIQLDGATPKSSSVSTPSKPSIDESLDQKNKTHALTQNSIHPTKSKPMSVFKQLAAKRMSGNTPTKSSNDSTSQNETPEKKPNAPNVEKKVVINESRDEKSSTALSPSVATSSSLQSSVHKPTEPSNEKTPPSIPRILQSALSTESIKEEDEEEEEEIDDTHKTEVKSQTMKKRSSMSKLFSSMAESTNSGDSKNDSHDKPDSAKNNVISDKQSSTTPSSDSLNAPPSVNSGPPVTGAGRKKPGRLSILQLSVGKDFNPDMLSGKPKPKPGQRDIRTASEPIAKSTRVHSDSEDGTKRLSEHTLTRAPSFRKKRPSVLKKGNVDELREKLITKIDMGQPKAENLTRNKSPPPPKVTTAPPPGHSENPPPQPSHSIMSSGGGPPLPPSAKNTQSSIKSSDIAPIPSHRGSGITPSELSPSGDDLTRRRSSTTVLKPPPPPPPPPKTLSSNGQPPPPPPKMKPSDISTIPDHKATGTAPSERPKELVRQRSSSISALPAGSPPPPPPPPKKVTDNDSMGQGRKSPPPPPKKVTDNDSMGQGGKSPPPPPSRGGSNELSEKRLQSKAKNEEYFAKLRKEEKRKEDEVEVSYKEIEEKQAAAAHDSKKTEHYARLGASFSKSIAMKGGGPGRGRSSIKKSLPSDMT